VAHPADRHPRAIHCGLHARLDVPGSRRGSTARPTGPGCGRADADSLSRVRNIIGFSDPNQGFAESLPSEAYLNFGLAGCVGAGLFLGALMGWAWRKHQATAARARDLLYPVLLAGLIGGFRSDAWAQIKEVLYPMLIVWVLMGLYRGSPTIGRLPTAKNQARLDRTRVG
jgi:hypothetical protein